MKAAEAINFDTHKFVKHLTENGFTEQQAEVLAEEQVNLLNTNLATKADILALKADIESLRLATKADIESLRLATKANIFAIKRDIEALRQETKADIEGVKKDIEVLRRETKADIESVKGYIEAVRSDLLKWMFGMMLTGIGLVAGLVVALVKWLP